VAVTTLSQLWVKSVGNASRRVPPYCGDVSAGFVVVTGAVVAPVVVTGTLVVVVPVVVAAGAQDAKSAIAVIRDADTVSKMLFFMKISKPPLSCWLSRLIAYLYQVTCTLLP
jgi:hypothetical protein